MSARSNLRSQKRCIAHAFHQQTLRQTFALALALGITAESISLAQHNAGDLPASPWSNRDNTKQTVGAENGNRVSSGRLRPPGSSVPSAATNERQPVTRQFDESLRPSPVILRGPELPQATLEFPPEVKSSAMPGSKPNDSKQMAAAPLHASTQKRSIEAPSDWQRVQAGGLILETQDSLLAEELDLNSERSLQKSAPLSSRRIGVGLPDRNHDESSEKLPSQMASTRSSPGRDEPITRRLPDRPASSYEDPEFESETLSVVTSSRGQPTAQEKTIHRSELAMELDSSRSKSSRGPFVQEAIPSLPRQFENESAMVGKDESAIGTRPADEIQMKRIALAQRVHHELVSNPAAALARAPEALESLPGWQSVERELKLRLERCDSLLKRGAVLSAREEASQGLLRLYRTMDLHRGSLFSEAGFEKAIAAIREEADFQRIIGGRQGSGVQAIVDTHTTEALKGRPLDSTSPELAAMHYRWFARYQLIASSDGHPWAADLLYAYGKTLEKDAELNPARANMFRSQAVVFYQAATQIAPTQSEVANQLGFALIHLDRMDDAYTALTASIQHKPNANAWNNLAEVFRRRGAVAEAEYAVQQASALSASTARYSPENPEITEVDPTVFAKYSPMPTMASPTQNYTPNNPPTNAPGGNASNVRSAKSGNSLFSKIFAK